MFSVHFLKHEDMVHGDALRERQVAGHLNLAEVRNGRAGVTQELLVLVLLCGRLVLHVRPTVPCVSTLRLGTEPGQTVPY